MIFASRQAHANTHTLSVSLPSRSWPWSTSTVTSVWTRPARRTAKCPASETAHTHAPNSGYSATSHYQRSSDHTPHTSKHTHSHTHSGPERAIGGTESVCYNWARGKERLPMRGFGKRGRTYWTVLPLPEIRGRSVFDTRKDSLSETMADVFVFIGLLFLKRF